MKIAEKISAACLCGDITISAVLNSDQFDCCHCDTCRRWGGGPWLALAHTTDVEIDGEENLRVFQSSDWAERGFCQHCGTHLFYRLRHENYYALPMELFKLPMAMHFRKQIFVDRRPAHYAFANKTAELTGEETFAAFQADGSNQ